VFFYTGGRHFLCTPNPPTTVTNIFQQGNPAIGTFLEKAIRD